MHLISAGTTRKRVLTLFLLRKAAIISRSKDTQRVDGFFGGLQVSNHVAELFVSLNGRRIGFPTAAQNQLVNNSKERERITHLDPDHQILKGGPLGSRLNWPSRPRNSSMPLTNW